MLTWRSWVHRRRESVLFRDEAVASRRIALELTVPDASAHAVQSAGNESLYFLPLTRLRKRVFTNFDVRDETGRALPLLLGDQCNEISTAALTALIRKQNVEVTPDVEEKCAKVAAEGPSGARLAARALGVVPAGTALATSSILRAPSGKIANPSRVLEQLTRALIRNYVMYVPLVGTPGTKRIIEFSYDEIVEDPNVSAWETLQRAAGWRGKKVWFPVPSLGDVPSYHLEVAAPEGLQITRRHFIVRRAGSEDKSAQDRFRRGPYGRARFYHKTEPGEVGFALVNLRPRTATIVRTACVTAWVAVALLAVAGIATAAGAFDEGSRSAPTLLLFVPSAISAYIARSSDHAMTADMVFGLRIGALLPGAYSFAGAAVLAVSADPSACAVLIILAVLALVTAAGWTLTWRRCAMSQAVRQRPAETRPVTVA